MIIANLSALRSTLFSAKGTLEFMKVEPHKMNCLIDAQEYVDDAIEELKLDGIEKGVPTAVPYMHRAIDRLERMKEYAQKDMKETADTVNALIVAQCDAIMPMLDQVATKALKR